MEDNLDTIIELKNSSIIADILNKAFMTVALQFNLTKENVPEFPAFISPGIIDNQLENGLKMYGYKDNDQIIGCVGYSYYKDQSYIIERLATLPEHRHLGVGRKLMSFAENKIIENNGKIAEIHVVNINDVLIEWYKKLSYRQIRVEKLADTPVELPFNFCVMNKVLI
jgi:ribosomal protein S18 acetylase RimI-like enzyme